MISNKAILQNAFGAENCIEWSNGYYRNITCIGHNVSSYAATDGYIDSGIANDCECYIHVGGIAACTCWWFYNYILKKKKAIF